MCIAVLCIKVEARLVALQRQALCPEQVVLLQGNFGAATITCVRTQTFYDHNDASKQIFTIIDNGIHNIHTQMYQSLSSIFILLEGVDCLNGN